MHRTVQDYEHQFTELACETVRRNIYVDDCFKSVNSVEEAVVLASELKELLARGGLNLTKWTSNYAAVLEEIPLSDRSKKIKERDMDAPLEERALGVYWSMEEDYLGFKTRVMNKPLTKRGILSMLSSICDPLGMASPFILGARRTVQDLCQGELGWDEKVGPSYEQQWRQEDWPKSEVASTLSHEDPEVKGQEAVAFAIQTQPESELVEKLIASYSHWMRLVRTVACFKSLARQDKSSESESRVGAPQLQQAEDSLIIHVQEQYYSEELIALRAGRGVSPSSPLYKFGPSLVKGIIVAAGRLKNASLPREAKEPPIIPHEHPIAEKIVRFTHEKTAHSGREYVVAEIRRKYWITGVRGLVKRVLRKCMTCRRQDARPCEQQMGDLPPDRVTSGGPAFMSVGVDYFGPIAVKRGRGREKRYGCLFTCLSSRAVHIEVVESLDTDSFINCLQRFIARRGLPELIRSDNGRNFVGAERELREGLQAWKQEKIEGDLSERGVRWIFNTPTASHMGGVWERQIRSVRRILSRLVQEQVMSSEVLTTLLVTAEGILNNRPLTAASSDPSDLEPLTPNHLLIHRPARAPPGLYANGDSRQEKRWRQVLHLADVFWQRWTREYLPLLRQRTKWQQPHRNVSRGDLVLVTDKQLPRNEWSTGRVINVIEGQDGLVRTAEVRTHAGTFLRPVVKLCVLEENAFGQQQNVDEIAPLKKRRRRAD